MIYQLTHNFIGKKFPKRINLQKVNGNIRLQSTTNKAHHYDISGMLVDKKSGWLEIRNWSGIQAVYKLNK